MPLTARDLLRSAFWDLKRVEFVIEGALKRIDFESSEEREVNRQLKHLRRSLVDLHEVLGMPT